MLNVIVYSKIVCESSWKLTTGFGINLVIFWSCSPCEYAFFHRSCLFVCGFGSHFQSIVIMRRRFVFSGVRVCRFDEVLKWWFRPSRVLSLESDFCSIGCLLVDFLIVIPMNEF